MLDGFGRYLRSATFGVKALIVATALTVTGFGLHGMWNDRREAIERSFENAENLSALVARHAEDAIRAADVLLLGLREAAETGQLDDASLRERLEAVLRIQSTAVPQLGVLSVLDADGRTLMSNTPAVMEMRFADRPYFQAARLATTRDLIIAPPIVGRATKEWIIPVVRRITRPDGSFGGLVFGALRGDYFLAFYESLAIGRQGSVLLNSSTADARLLVRRPFSIDAVGFSVAEGPIMRDLVPRARAGRTETKAVTDGVIRLSAYHQLDTYPVVAIVAFAKDEVLEAWHDQALGGLGTIIAADIGIFLLGWLVVSQLRRRIRADEAHKASERRFSTAFFGSPTPHSIRNADGICVEVNDAMVRLVGVPRDEMIGRTQVQAGILTEAQWGSLQVALAREGSLIQGLDYEVRVRDGSERTGLLFVSPILLDDQPHTLWSFLDLTTQRRLEEEARHAQKLQAIGELTGGVAHDFNNLLAVIQGNVEQVSDGLRRSPDIDLADIDESVSEALNACKRGASLTRNLLAFGRRELLTTQVFDPVDVIRELTALLGRTLPASINVTLVADSRGGCLADPGQFQNAILNLVFNARDAMPEGGGLVLRISAAVFTSSSPSRPAELAPGRYVAISVTDTGSGMSPDVLGRAFDPFFTTKAVGQGSGLGLSMVYGFAKQSNGHVTIESRPGSGTTATLYLPRSDALPRDSSARPESAAKSGKGQAILVVEDDVAVRSVTVRHLRQAGYIVAEAADATAGLAMIDRLPQLDVLLTDVILTGTIRGYEFAAAARKKRPHLRVIYMSGYTDAMPPGDDQAPLLRKPFSGRELSVAVNRVLAERVDA